MAGRGIEHCRELLELVGIQAKENLIKYYRLRFVAGSLEHEVRAILTQQSSGVINQVSLLG
jgi:hypothetical protein